MSDTATPPRIQIVDLRPRGTMTVRGVTVVRLALFGLLAGNLGRIPAFSTGERDAAILLNDLFVALLIGLLMLRVTTTRLLRFDRVGMLALAFAGIGALSTLLSIPRFGLTTFETLVSLSYLVRWLFYFGVYVVVINIAEAADAESLWEALELVILGFALFGILQSIALPNFAQLVYPNSRVGADWDDQGHRLVSTWLDPVFAGSFIVIGLLIELSRISVGVQVARWKPLVLAVAMLLTASRGALVAFIVGVIAIIAVRGISRRLVRLVAAVVAVLIVGTPLVLRLTGLSEKLHVDASALQRVIAWTRALRVFSDHPIIGVGFNAWGFVQERYGYERLYAFSYSLDGGLIFVALMTGVVGLGVFLWMTRTMILRARVIWRSLDYSQSERGLAIGITAATLSLFANSLFVNSLFLPFLMETLWLLWAIVFLISRRTAEAK